MNSELHSHDDFDTRLQQLHAQALTTLSADTLSRLRQARRAATPRHRHAHWLLATACSALLATGIGLHLSSSTGISPSIATPTPALQQLDMEDVLLDENPDLYLWLATENSLAME